MNVIINGDRIRVSAGTSLERAISLVSRAASGIAVAVNGEVVRRASWATTMLAAGDEIEVLTAVQGG